MENTHSWTCDNEIGTTLPQYANSQGITYEAVRRQVIKYQDTELRGHIQIRNKTKYLDDFAVEFLNEHRRPQAQIDSDANNIAEQLKDMLIYIKENKSNPQKAHQFQPFKDYISNTPEDAFARKPCSHHTFIKGNITPSKHQALRRIHMDAIAQGVP